MFISKQKRLKTNMTESVVKISTNAAKWTLISVWTKRLLGLISTLVLIRYLTPSDLGVAISAMVVLMFAQAITEAGSRQYIIQNDGLNHQQICCAWSISLVMKLAASVMIFCFSFIAETIFDSENMQDVLKVCCVLPILVGLKNPGLFIDEKNDQYRNLNIIPVISKIISLPVTITIAIIYQSFWSLIIGSILEAIIDVSLSYYYNKFRPRFTLLGVKQQLKFSNYFFVMSIFGYLRSRFENFAIISLFGVKGNGLYSIAQEIAFLPMTELVQPIQRGFYATAASLKSSKTHMFELYAKQSNWVLLILVPCFFGLLAIQDVFTLLVLGDKWIEAGSVLPIFTATSIPLSLYLLIICILTIENKFNYIIAIDVCYTIVLAAITYYVENFTLIYFTTLRAFLSFIMFSYYLVAIRMLYKVNILFMLTALPAITLSSFIMYFCVIALKQEVGGLHLAIQFFILTLTGMTTYILLLFLCCKFSKKQNQRIIEIFDIYRLVYVWTCRKLNLNTKTKHDDSAK